MVIPVGREGFELFDRIRVLNLSLKELSSASNNHVEFETVLVTDVFDIDTVRSMMAIAKSRLARCYLLTTRVGKGGSIKNVINLLRGDYIVTIDADIPVKPEIILRAPILMRRYNLDVLIAHRVYRNNISNIRAFLSVAYNCLVNLFFKTGVRDHQAGFKVYSKKAASLLLLKLSRSDDLSYDTEVIVWARKLGLRYAVIPVVWLEKRNRSTIKLSRAIIPMFTYLIALRVSSFLSEYIPANKAVIGKVIDLSNLSVVSSEFATVNYVNDVKYSLFKLLKRLYVTILRKG
ncbi:MAG: glycosyltransferase [Desulfurococcaceae archaeon]